MGPQEELLGLLKADGHEDIFNAVSSGKANELSPSRKELLVEYARKLQNPVDEFKPDVRDALVEVSSSGWSREADTTLPGKVISSSLRR